MSWTCEKCKVTGHDPACWKCGAPRVAGLSEEERAAWECLGESFGIERRALEATEEEWERDHCAIRTRFMAFWKAARAPLEAELTKMRERVRELEARGDKWQCLINYFWTHPERSIHGELPAQIVQVLRSHDAKMIERAMRISELEAQLAQAQKPVAPAGLPEASASLRAESAKDKARIAELEEDIQLFRADCAKSDECALKAGAKAERLTNELAVASRERDAALAEVERLKGELATLREFERRVTGAMVAKNRAAEERVPQVGDEIWWSEYLTMKDRASPRKVKVLKVRKHEFRIDDGRDSTYLSDSDDSWGVWLRFDSAGVSWWWDDPAKGTREP